MKSILQEASTIAKAVEQGWKEAGEPQEFSVKILELPQRNFIGLTTRSAKIAFIFNGAPLKPEHAPKHHQKAHAPRERKETFTPSAGQPRQHHNAQQQAQHNQPQPQIQREQRDAFAPKKERTFTPVAASEGQAFAKKRPEGFWTEEMVTYARDWFATSLKHMDRPDITFTIEPQTFYLRVTLSKPVFAEEGQEKHLLASISSLMLATIKKQFRKALRGHKIVLTHAQG
jgi:hypothetical protein